MPNRIPEQRDQLAADLVRVRRLLGRIREAAFGQDPDTGFAEIRRILVDNWQDATPAGRSFDLMRSVDTSGVSGTGRVAEGFEFENGKVALCWLGPMSSVNVYDSLDHVRAIHGHGGHTQVVPR